MSDEKNEADSEASEDAWIAQAVYERILRSGPQSTCQLSADLGVSIGRTEKALGVLDSRLERIHEAAGDGEPIDEDLQPWGIALRAPRPAWLLAWLGRKLQGEPKTELKKTG